MIKSTGSISLNLRLVATVVEKALSPFWFEWSIYIYPGLKRNDIDPWVADELYKILVLWISLTINLNYGVNLGGFDFNNPWPNPERGIEGWMCYLSFANISILINGVRWRKHCYHWYEKFKIEINTSIWWNVIIWIHIAQVWRVQDGN